MGARELLGLPFRMSSMPVLGTAMPVTIAGTLALATSEALACNAVMLALNGQVYGWCETPVGFDMRAGASTANGPDVQLLRLASRQMAAYVFGGEYTALAGLGTTAKVPCAQAVLDKSLDAMWGFCAGMRSFASLGILAESDLSLIHI